jgi:DNA-binding NarL/FixJ family response regulator
MPRILLADDQRLVREGLRLLLQREGFEIVAETSSGAEVIGLTRVHQPDIAILERFLPSVDGVESARAIRAQQLLPRVILLAPVPRAADVLFALRAGIKGYVSKREATAELVAAIRAVHAGAIHLSPAIVQAVGRSILRN